MVPGQGTPKMYAEKRATVYKGKGSSNYKTQDLDTRCLEIGESWPIAELPRIATDPHKGGVRWGRPIEDEKLEPSHRADTFVGWGGDGAGRARAADGRKQRTLAHAVAVRAGLGSHQGGARVRKGPGGDLDRDRLAVGPVLVCDRERWRSGSAGHAIRRDENLHPIFFWVLTILRIRARDHDAPIVHQDGLGVIQTGNSGVCHDRHALVYGLAGIIKHGVEIGASGEAETCHTLMGTVENHVCSVGKRRHAGDDSLGRHTLESPLRVRGLGLRRNAIVRRSTCSIGRATANQDGDWVVKRCILWQKHGGPLERVGTSSRGIVDVAWHVW